MFGMIIDAHTHLWHSPDQLGPQISAQLRQEHGAPGEELDASPQAHESAIEPVDLAFVLGFRSRYLGAEVPNDTLAAAVASRGDRLIGFAGIDPMTEDYMAELDRLPAMKLSGVVISPADQAFHPSHTRAMKLYEKCQSMGMPLVIHQGGPFTRDSMLEYAEPALLDEVARSFPQLKLLIAGCGHPWTDQTLVLVAKHRNVYTEIGGVVGRPWQLYNVLLAAHQMDVTDRLLFGSGFPFNHPSAAVETIYSLHRFTQGTGLLSVPREKLRAIVERDALSCLGLKRSAPAGGARAVAGEARSAARAPAASGGAA